MAGKNEKRAEKRAQQMQMRAEEAAQAEEMKAAEEAAPQALEASEASPASAKPNKIMALKGLLLRHPEAKMGEIINRLAEDGYPAGDEKRAASAASAFASDFWNSCEMLAREGAFRDEFLARFPGFAAKIAARLEKRAA